MDLVGRQLVHFQARANVYHSLPTDSVSPWGCLPRVAVVSGSDYPSTESISSLLIGSFTVLPYRVFFLKY